MLRKPITVYQADSDGAMMTEVVGEGNDGYTSETSQRGCRLRDHGPLGGPIVDGDDIAVDLPRPEQPPAVDRMSPSH